MFHPVDRHMERGWVGRIDGDRVTHLAAQTLQHFFTGGASAREHAEYPLSEVTLLAPVPHPPAVRVFEDETAFAFGNPAAIVGPGAAIHPPGDTVVAHPRLAGIVGADGTIAGFTLTLELRDAERVPPKDRDFGLALGPLVVTTDELLGCELALVVRVDGLERLSASGDGIDWEAVRRSAADGTQLRTGDLLAGPAAGRVEANARGSRVELDAPDIGVLAISVA
jgi:fumarylacetoacetate (FAA) hydrolase family protein